MAIWVEAAQLLSSARVQPWPLQDLPLPGASVVRPATLPVCMAWHLTGHLSARSMQGNFNNGSTNLGDYNL